MTGPAFQRLVRSILRNRVPTRKFRATRLTTVDSRTVIHSNAAPVSGGGVRKNLQRLWGNQSLPAPPSARQEGMAAQPPAIDPGMVKTPPPGIDPGALRAPPAGVDPGMVERPPAEANPDANGASSGNGMPESGSGGEKTHAAKAELRRGFMRCAWRLDVCAAGCTV